MPTNMFKLRQAFQKKGQRQQLKNVATTRTTRKEKKRTNKSAGKLFKFRKSLRPKDAVRTERLPSKLPKTIYIGFETTCQQDELEIDSDTSDMESMSVVERLQPKQQAKIDPTTRSSTSKEQSVANRNTTSTGGNDDLQEPLRNQTINAIDAQSVVSAASRDAPSIWSLHPATTMERMVSSLHALRGGLASLPHHLKQAFDDDDKQQQQQEETRVDKPSEDNGAAKDATNKLNQLPKPNHLKQAFDDDDDDDEQKQQHEETRVDKPLEDSGAAKDVTNKLCQLRKLLTNRPKPGTQQSPLHPDVDVNKQCLLQGEGTKIVIHFCGSMDDTSDTRQLIPTPGKETRGPCNSSLSSDGKDNSHLNVAQNDNQESVKLCAAEPLPEPVSREACDWTGSTDTDKHINTCPSQEGAAKSNLSKSHDMAYANKVDGIDESATRLPISLDDNNTTASLFNDDQADALLNLASLDSTESGELVPVAKIPVRSSFSFSEDDGYEMASRSMDDADWHGNLQTTPLSPMPCTTSTLGKGDSNNPRNVVISTDGSNAPSSKHVGMMEIIKQMMDPSLLAGSFSFLPTEESHVLRGTFSDFLTLVGQSDEQVQLKCDGFDFTTQFRHLSFPLTGLPSPEFYLNKNVLPTCDGADYSTGIAVFPMTASNEAQGLRNAGDSLVFVAVPGRLPKSRETVNLVTNDEDDEQSKPGTSPFTGVFGMCPLAASALNPKNVHHKEILEGIPIIRAMLANFEYNVVDETLYHGCPAADKNGDTTPIAEVRGIIWGALNRYCGCSDRLVDAALTCVQLDTQDDLSQCGSKLETIESLGTRDEVPGVQSVASEELAYW